MKEHFKEFHRIKTYTKYTARGEARYVAELQYTALNAVRVITEIEPWILETKIKNQFDKWDDMFSKSYNKSQAQLEKEVNLNSADEKTKESQEAIQEIENILKAAVNANHQLDWVALFDTKTFTKPNPKDILPKEIAKIAIPKEPTFKDIPPEPNKYFFEPKLSFFDKIIKSSAQKKIQNSETLYEQAMFHWNNDVKKVERENANYKDSYNKALENYENEKLTIEDRFKILEKEWEDEIDNYYSKQNEFNQKIKNLKESYNSNEAVAVVEYCDLVLRSSEYPENFPKEFDLEYNSENKFLIVDYVLPAPENFPKIIEVKYIAAKKEMKEVLISDTQFAKLYDTQWMG